MCSGLGLCDKIWLQLEAERKIGPPGKKESSWESLGHHEANAILLSSLVFPLPVGSCGTFFPENNPHPVLLVGLMMITAFRPSS